MGKNYLISIYKCMQLIFYNDFIFTWYLSIMDSSKTTLDYEKK